MVNSLFVFYARRFLSSCTSGHYWALVSRPGGGSQYRFITVDTTRADRMGFLGSKRGLRRIWTWWPARASFSSGIFASALDPGSHATIFTGTYPQFHTVTDFGHPLPTLLPSVPRFCKKAVITLRLSLVH